MQKPLAIGAEAVLTKSGNRVLKHRIRKRYRHAALDRKLRTLRTRHEARMLTRLQKLEFPAPRITKVDERRGLLEMGFIDGPLVRDVFDKRHRQLAPEIGRKLAQLHAQHIIHGDVTTSNMILSKEIVFIDFGLGFLSRRVEDKAVDLHLLDRALESRHYLTYPKSMERVLAAYREAYPEAAAVLARYEEVKKRGRYKGKRQQTI